MARKPRVGEDRGEMVSVRMFRKDWNFTAGTLALDEQEWKTGHPDAEPEEREDMVRLNRRILDRIGDEVRRHDRDTRFSPTKYERIFVSAYDRNREGQDERVRDHTRRQLVKGGGASQPALRRRRHRPGRAREMTTIYVGEFPNGLWATGYFDETGFHQVGTGRPDSKGEIVADLINRVEDSDGGTKGGSPSLMKSPPLAADEFFKAAAGNENPFAANHFGGGPGGISGYHESSDFVGRLESTGATVVVAGILAEEWRIEKEGGPYADTLYVDTRTSRSPDMVVSMLREQSPDELNEVEPGVWRAWWD